MAGGLTLCPFSVSINSSRSKGRKQCVCLNHKIPRKQRICIPEYSLTGPVPLDFKETGDLFVNQLQRCLENKQDTAEPYMMGCHKNKADSRVDAPCSLPSVQTATNILRLGVSQGCRSDEPCISLPKGDKRSRPYSLSQ